MWTLSLSVCQVNHPCVTNVLPLPRNKHNSSVAVTVSLLLAAPVLNHCSVLSLTSSFGLSFSPCSAWPLGDLLMVSFCLLLPKPCCSTIFHMLVHPVLESWYNFSFLGFFLSVSVFVPQVFPALFVLLHSLVAHSALCPASQNALPSTSCSTAFSCSQTDSFSPSVSLVFIPVSSEMYFRSIDLSGTYLT